MLVGFRIEIGHVLARVILVLSEVVVGSVGNAPKLAPSEREEELKVGSCLGVEAKLVRIVIAKTKVFISHSKVKKELMAIVLPVCKPFKVGAGLAEEFKLHLLKLSGTENEVSGGDLVSEGLTDLRYAERKLLSG